MRGSITLVTLLVALVSKGQEHSQEDGKEFLYLVQQTKEYKAIRAVADSVNKQEKEVPQNVSFVIERSINDPDQHILTGLLMRKAVIGFSGNFKSDSGIPLETYTYTYDSQQRKIISIKHSKQK